MNLGALRALATSLAFATHGVPATVIPFGGGPIATRVIWLPQVGTEAQTFTDRPFGSDRERRDPRRVIAVERVACLTALPRGSVIVAPERSDLEPATWTVDGHDMTDVAQFRVMVVQEAAA